jgi:hypothetical protein
MAEAGACAAKIVRSKVVKANSFGISLHGVPDYVGFYSVILSSAVLQNSPEHFALSHSRVAEPSINQIFTPDWYRNRSQSSALPNQIDDHPVVLPRLQLTPISSSLFRSVANRIRVAVRSLQHLFSREVCVEKWHSIGFAPGLQ